MQNGTIKETIRLSNGTEIIIKSMTIVEELDAMERKAYFDGIKNDYIRQQRSKKAERRRRIERNPFLRLAAWCGIL